MSDEQKIWFLYITDHHEGPFDEADVAERLQQGLVNGQSLTWKDGMAEWVPLETIQELQHLVAGGAAAPAELTSEASGGGGGESLAAMLAASQARAGGDTAADGVMDLSVDDVQEVSDVPPQSVPSAAPAGLSAVMAGGSNSIAGREPDEKEPIWILRSGQQITGLLSLRQLVEMASSGQIPDDSLVWHPGWNDFRPVLSVATLVTARKNFKGQVAKGLASITPGEGRTKGLSPITAAADIGDDEPTDPHIEREPAEPKGFQKILAKLKAAFKKKPKEEKASPIKKTTTGKILAPSKVGAVKKPSKLGGILKALVILLLLAAAGGGGAYYYLFLLSPLPRDLDVNAADHEAMKTLVSTKLAPGAGQFYMAVAKGTEDNPADEMNPKFYVATNLPVGASVSLQISGVPGTLVNRVSLEKTFTAAVTKSHYAVFEDFRDDGKPLPMGDYKIKLTAEGAKPFEMERFLGGKKGAVYEKRLKQYKEKLQVDYDKEVTELRELINTLKTLQTEMSKKMVEFKAGASSGPARTKIAMEWKVFFPTYQGMAMQMDSKIKEYMQSGSTRYHARSLQDISTTLNQMSQWVQMHNQQMEGVKPAGNIDELEGLVEAGVVSLEQWVSQAIMKSPFDVAKPEAGAAPAAPTGEAKPAAPAAQPAKP